MPADASTLAFESRRVTTDGIGIHEMKNCGHNIPEEQPEALARALLWFFGRRHGGQRVHV
ncbi:hypothetical protein OOT46_04020 [Aquabacterium sp. A7-Y]|uniref:alpha/beta fold hydrolase n=1 Tax=Aquabacterium sp. A7-Y TaxID=1349605 RepID=UPI00223D9FBD|nr:hypothetical protein [Aquabacterium sp. A7-Y]MCW7537020.1 hypothetical protein [Aquabacterium sp. A7-Y]